MIDHSLFAQGDDRGDTAASLGVRRLMIMWRSSVQEMKFIELVTIEETRDSASMSTFYECAVLVVSACYLNLSKWCLGKWGARSDFKLLSV
eukprot:scaffold9413_cov129-Skeletonema_menzelii.AAC.8